MLNLEVKGGVVKCSCFQSPAQIVEALSWDVEQNASEERRRRRTSSPPQESLAASFCCQRRRRELLVQRRSAWSNTADTLRNSRSMLVVPHNFRAGLNLDGPKRM